MILLPRQTAPRVCQGPLACGAGRLSRPRILSEKKRWTAMTSHVVAQRSMPIVRMESMLVCTASSQ
eukprot:789115-Rhodomonas_salina.2